MPDPVTIERRDAVEILTLNRPDKLNAMDEPMIAELRDYFMGLPSRDEVRVVVFRAEGRAFCAGLDLGGWQNDASRGSVHHVWRTQFTTSGAPNE